MKNSNTLLGFIVGAAAGATLGILFAPEKGSETREKLAAKGGEFSDDFKSKFADLVDNLTEKSKNLFNKGEAIAKEGKSTIEQINKNIVSEVS